MKSESSAELGMKGLNLSKERWVEGQFFNCGIFPDKLGRIDSRKLKELTIEEQVKDGWTYLTLTQWGSPVAQARYQWGWDMTLHFETLP